MAETAPLDELTEAVLFAESRGRRFDAKGKLLEGPKTRHGTAKGEMQVLDKTMRNPGYGVVGARDSSPDERARVGREYLAAMSKKYGDQTAALAAYNWGPGNTNKWLEKGAKFEDLPTETQNYITGIQARMAQRRAAVAPATPSETAVAVTPARMNPNLQAQGQKAAAAREAATPKPAAATTTPAPATTPEQLLSSASQYGPDYQAALALAALGDDDDDEEYTTKSGEPLVRARSMLDEMTAEPAPKTALADLNLKVASPFAAMQPKGGGPVRLAVGGMVEPITPMGMQVQSPFANSANPTVANMAGNVPRGTMPGQSTVFRAEGSSEQGERARPQTLNQFLQRQGSNIRNRPTDDRLSKMMEMAAGFHPVAGPVLSAKDFEVARKEGNAVGMGLAGLGMLPVVGGMLKPAKAGYEALKNLPDVIGTFKTSRGSVYAHHGDATTTRNRSGAMHRDTTEGVQPRSGRTIFVDNKDASSIAGVFQNPDIATRIVPTFDAAGKPTGKANLELLEDYGPRKAGTSLHEFSYEMQPKTGKAPVEIYRSESPIGSGGEGVHFGTEIVEILPVNRAEGSPESGETPARSTLESFKEQTKAFGRGVADLPYTIVGAPVDIATFIGRNVPGVSKLLPGINQEQTGSSEHLKRLMERTGLREAAPTQPNLKAAYEAGSMLSSFASPTGVVLGARRMIGKTGEAAKALREMPAQEVAALPAPAPAPARARPPVAPVEEPRPAPQPPVQQELPLPVPEPTPVPAPAPVAVAAPTASRQMLQAMPEVTPPVTPAAPAVPKWDELALHEKAERPFISKLEMYVDQMQGKTTPEQFLKGLKGKFRDHEIARAQEALADVAPGTKLTGQDIGSRLADLYSPRGWKTEIKEPKVGQFYAPHDNPFPGEAIGAINLLERAPAYVSESKKMLKDLPHPFSLLRTDELPEEQLQNFEKFLSTPYAEALPQGEKILKDLRGLVQQYRQTPSAELKQLMSEVEYPILSPKYEQIKAQMKEADTWKLAGMEQATNQIAKEALQTLNKRLGTNIKPDDPFSLGPGLRLPDLVLEELRIKVSKAVEKDTVAANLFKQTRQTLEPLDAVKDKYKLYTGQHSTIASDNPIGFSRFVEIPAVIPGQGQTQALHVLELQTDRLDDLRTLGKRGSSVEKDREITNKHDAVIEQLLAPFPKGSNQRDYLDNTRTDMIMELTENSKRKSGDSSMDRALDLLGDLPDELQGVGQKMLNEIKAQVPAKRRLLASNYLVEKTPPTYRIHEAFAGMEQKPQEVQQLLIKNAINGAIERGLSMVSFPSVESKEAQLYRNVANNMRQVIKDLGGEKAGFELLMVEHKNGLTGKTYQSPAIRWGDETADKLRQTGIPFKKGGLVERKMDDNRTYL